MYVKFDVLVNSFVIAQEKKIVASWEFNGAELQKHRGITGRFRPGGKNSKSAWFFLLSDNISLDLLHDARETLIDNVISFLLSRVKTRTHAVFLASASWRETLKSEHVT